MRTTRKRLTHKLFFLFIIVALVLPRSAKSQGGPPMLTDDCSTVPTGKWEDNFAAIYTGSAHDFSLALPMLDINFGANQRTQLKIEMPWTSINGQPVAHKFDNITLGVKYRFLDEDSDGVALSTYPQPIISFNPDDRSKHTEYGFILPLAASKEFFSVEWDLQVGYQLLGNVSEIFYGLVASKEVLPSFVLLAEIHEAFDKINSSDAATATFLRAGTFVNLGTQWQLTNTFTILAAFGKDLDANADAPGQPRFYGYGGMQVHL